MTTSRRIIVSNIEGQKYLLTSRRLVEMDSASAKIKEPWFTTTKAIRDAAKEMLQSPHGAVRGIKVFSLARYQCLKLVTVEVSFGKSMPHPKFPQYWGLYHIGCAYFDFKTFKRILRASGVQGTQKKAFAAKVGA
jgi:hypothetical protein